MTKPARPIEISHKYEVLQQPTGEKALAIPLHEWDRIMNRVEKMGDSSHGFVTLGWSCISIGISFLLAAISFPFSVDFVRRDAAGNESIHRWAALTEGFNVCVFVISLAIGAVSFFYARRHRLDRADRRQDIIEDMRLTRDRFRSVPASNTSGAGSPPASP